GEDPASQVYVRNKVATCERLGMASVLHRLPATTTEAELLALVARLNVDPAVHGILVQLPLPAHIHDERVIEAISPAKDVDGFHVANVGALAIGRPRFVPCTPAGCMELLASLGLRDLRGKHAVVIGRSNIVGKPMALLLLQANATVTICHSGTAELAAHCRRADILVVAVGRPRFVSADWVKPGAIVIDVGINRLPETEGGGLAGDVDFERVREVAGAITPVPGGVGPMTIAMLMQNTLVAAGSSQHAPC
ncbi:MAG: bifunctional 5,10-methylenetetrahydrofolate dehydrogenase/5,10-methenyltetrahydrofolate cyclohydrolase, partial [Casimicrobiaceae bacterium]